MKIQLLVLPFVALPVAVAHAQTKAKPAAPKAMASMPIEPAAKALLDRATATYKGASGVRFRVENLSDGKDAGSSRVAFSRPNLLSIQRQSGPNSLQLLLDGSSFYLVQNAQYRKQPALPGSAAQFISSAGVGSGQLIGAMLDGKNPLAALQALYARPPFVGSKSRTVALAPRVVDGDVLSGTQTTFSLGIPGPGNTVSPVGLQLTAWFGGAPLALRRVQSRYSQNGKISTLSERVLDQQLDPAFETDTFKFKEAGLKPVSDAAPEEEAAYFDARLKVGTDPFAFEAKDLSGQPLSLAKYKGKVVLMDFWATWCGPCVASLPDLQAAYKTYHPQGLEVVGISLDEDKNSLTSFIKAKNMAWPQIFDGKGWNSRVPGIYGVKAIPFMLLIGKDGKIAAVNPRDDIASAVKAALAAS